MLSTSYKSIFLVALPLMGASFIQSIVLLTDAAFLSRYSTLAFDASGNAGLIYITLFVALQGIGDGSQIIQARRIGEKRINEIGRILGTTIWTNLSLAFVLFMVIQIFMPSALLSYSKHADLAHTQSIYIGIRSYALFFVVFTLAANAYFFASGQTGKVLIASLVTAFSNIFLDYCMIFGNFGFEKMGIAGAAWASTIADGLGMITTLLLLLLNSENWKNKLFHNLGFRWSAMKNLLQISSPLILQGFLALSTWTIFFTWIEQMGKFELTVSQNIRSIYFLAFIPIWGFAATTKTYISQYIGGNKKRELVQIQRRIQILTMICLIVIFHGAFLYPETMIRWINPSEQYVAKSASILRLVAPSILLFGYINVYYQTINGSGNTKITLVIESTCVMLYMLTSYLFIKSWNLDIYYVWIVEYVYFAFMGTMSFFYLKKFIWQEKII